MKGTGIARSNLKKARLLRVWHQLSLSLSISLSFSLSMFSMSQHRKALSVAKESGGLNMVISVMMYGCLWYVYEGSALSKSPTVCRVAPSSLRG